MSVKWIYHIFVLGLSVSFFEKFQGDFQGNFANQSVKTLDMNYKIFSGCLSLMKDCYQWEAHYKIVTLVRGSSLTLSGSFSNSRINF